MCVLVIRELTNCVCVMIHLPESLAHSWKLDKED